MKSIFILLVIYNTAIFLIYLLYFIHIAVKHNTRQKYQMSILLLAQNRLLTACMWLMPFILSSL